MWVCLSNAFFSIVHKDCGPDELLVRARRHGDIESVFPDALVVKSHDTDYLFRAVLPRARVAEAIAVEVSAIDYGNFKNSVRNTKLHNAYSAVWGIMARLQPSKPRAARQGGLL